MLVHQKHEPEGGKLGQAAVIKNKTHCVASNTGSYGMKISPAQAQIQKFKVSGIAKIDL